MPGPKIWCRSDTPWEKSSRCLSIYYRALRLLGGTVDAKALRHLPLHLRGNTPRPQKSYGLARGQPGAPLRYSLGGDPGAGRKRLAPTVNLWVAAGSERSAASICRRSCCTMKSFGPVLRLLPGQLSLQ